MRVKETVQGFRRRRGVELMEQGLSTHLIAEVLGVTPASLYKWRKLSRIPGGLDCRLGGGRPRKLSEEQLAELEALLLQGAVAHGWLNDYWTASRVADLIQRHFNVQCCTKTAWRTLKRYMRWTVQRPIRQLRERNEDAIQRWVKHYYPLVLERAYKSNTSLVFVDESGFMSSPTIRHTFAPRGRTPVIKTANPHGRISVIGALIISPKWRHFGLHFHLLNDNANFHAESVRQFIRELGRMIKTPFTVVWDSVPIHKAKPVVQYVASNHRIAIENFPPYAPS